MRVAYSFDLHRLWSGLSAACLLVLLLAGGSALALQFDAHRITQYARTHYGERAAVQVDSWLGNMNQSQALPEDQQLRAVNDFWNYRIRGGEDIHIWGQTDYWATPLETLAKGAGDCEDFVIAKYFSLIRTGVAPDKLRFIYVRARVGGIYSDISIAHMVLGYYATPNAEPLILDNLTGSIQPASRRPDLTPVFSFNAQGVYVSGAAARSVDRIGHWQGLLAKMKKEGFVP